MQIKHPDGKRAPTRLGFNKENIGWEENSKVVKLKNTKVKVKHLYETHFPK